MSNNRLIAIFAALVLLVAAAFTIGSGIATALVGSIVNDLAGRHPELVNSRINVEPMDYIQRHPESLNPSNAVDLSDFYARHPGASIALNTAGAPDWFQRHPDSLNPSNAVDLSDYYARHPGKEQDDLVTTGPSDRHLPGKEQDDLVTARP